MCVSFLEEEKLTFGAIVLMDLVHNGTFKVVHHGLFNTRDVIVKQLRGTSKKYVTLFHVRKHNRKTILVKKIYTYICTLNWHLF